MISEGRTSWPTFVSGPQSETPQGTTGKCLDEKQTNIIPALGFNLLDGLRVAIGDPVESDTASSGCLHQLDFLPSGEFGRELPLLTRVIFLAMCREIIKDVVACQVIQCE